MYQFTKSVFIDTVNPLAGSTHIMLVMLLLENVAAVVNPGTI